MRICLITPAHLSTNPRLIKEADALSEAGHAVTVIAATFSLWGAEADTTFAAKSWRALDPLPVGPHAPRFRRAVQLFRHHGARWLVRLGVRDPAIIQAAWRQVAPDLTAAAKKVRADLYIAHYPAALPAAAIAARIHGAAYAFDAEDFHMGDPPDDPAFDQQRLMTDAIERRYLPGCAFMTAASPAIADAYVQAHGVIRPTILLNTFPRAQGPLEATVRGDMSPRPSVYWFSQTIGPGRGLEVAVRAIAQAESRPHLYLRGHPAKGFREQLEAMAREIGVSNRMHFLPPAPPAEMERLAARFDVGLSGEPGHTTNNRLALGNKLFSYLLAGLPIAASDVPSHQRFAAEAAEAIRLFVADDPGSLAEALDSFLLSDQALATARAAAFRLGQERFNWDIEKEALLSCVDRLSSVTSEPGP